MIKLLLFALLVGSLVGCTAVQSDDSVLQGKRGDVSAFIFTSVDCPIANAMAPQMQRTLGIARELGVRTYLVYPREDLSLDVISAHSDEYQLEATVVSDPQKNLVEELGATVTPEGVVIEYLDPNRYQIRYRGRLNDLYPSIGNRRDEVSSYDFRDAIIAVCNHQPVRASWVPAVGCMIERGQ